MTPLDSETAMDSDYKIPFYLRWLGLKYRTTFRSYVFRWGILRPYVTGFQLELNNYSKAYMMESGRLHHLEIDVILPYICAFCIFLPKWFPFSYEGGCLVNKPGDTMIPSDIFRKWGLSWQYSGGDHLFMMSFNKRFWTKIISGTEREETHEL